MSRKKRTLCIFFCGVAYMSQDSLFVKLELPKKPFKINDLAGGRPPTKCLILHVFIKKPVSV